VHPRLGVNNTGGNWEKCSNRDLLIFCHFSDYSPSLCRLNIYDISFYTVYVQFIVVQAAPVQKYFCTLCPCSGCSRAEIFLYTMSLFRLRPCRNNYEHYVSVQAFYVQKYLCTLCPCSGCPRAEIFIYSTSLFRLLPCINIYVHYVPAQAVPGLQAGVPPLQLGVLPPVRHGLLQVWLRGQR
jgi:hypothetical protein